MSHKKTVSFFALTAFILVICGLSFAGTTGVSPQGVALPSTMTTGTESPLPSETFQKIFIDRIRGVVSLKKSGQNDFKPITEKTAASPGDTLKTEEGLCEITLENQATLFIAPKTVLEITQASLNQMIQARDTELLLHTGRLKAKISKLSEASHFQVRTPTAVAAVRGTVIFVNTGMLQDKQFTEVYVDETTKGVDFVNTVTGERFHMDAFQVSSAFGDGTLLIPSNLNPEERAAFIHNWETAVQEALAKGDVEEMEKLGWKTVQVNDSESLGDALKDALKDKLNEQNAFGQGQRGLSGSLGYEFHNANIETILGYRDEVQRDFERYGSGIPEETVSADDIKNIIGSYTERMGNGDVYSSVNSVAGASTYSSYEWSYGSVRYEGGPFTGSGGNGDLGIVGTNEITNEALEYASGRGYLDRGSLLERAAQLKNYLDALENDLVNAEASDDNSLQLSDAQSHRNAYFDYLRSGSGDALSPEELLSAYQGLVERYNRVQAIREQERQAMRSEIRYELGRLRSDLDFEQRDALMEKTLDAQTGKVFTDIHGNRVRVDQYLFRPTDSSVQVLSLTLRTGEYQPGISSMSYGIMFNSPITQPVRDLPWADYFNVVSKDELASRLHINHGSNDYDRLADQYIVHEMNPSLAETFYPVQFYAEFKNPSQGEMGTRDTIRFDEVYGTPGTVCDRHWYWSENSNKRYLAQGLEASSIWIKPAAGQSLLYIDRRAHDPYVFLNVTDFSFNNLAPVISGGQDIGDETLIRSVIGSQTPSFVGDFTPEDLLNFDNILRDHRNLDLSDSNDYYPAYMEKDFTFRQGYAIVTKSLVGFFIPIDNEGGPLASDSNRDGYGWFGSDRSGSGFQILGLRDILSPNPHVNAGHYNLEIIFAYGSKDWCGNFDEEFRIDTIVTPEMFTVDTRAENYSGGINTVNSSTSFPSSLDDNDRDHRRISYAFGTRRHRS